MSVTLENAWQKTLRQSPGALAVDDRSAGRRWTRRDLEDAAAAWVRGLPNAGVLRRRSAVLAQPNGGDWLVLLLGLLKAGAVPVAVDAGEDAVRLRETAAAVGASWIWHEGKLHPLSGGRAVRDREGCLVKLTSGSTGVPRGLMFTHAQMIADGRNICSTMGIRQSDRNLGVIPFGHSYGLGNIVVPLLLQGTAVVASGPMPGQIVEDCRRAKPTVFPAVPALLRVLVESEVEPRALADLRLVISAGSALAPETAAAFHRKFRRKVHGFYGSSETGGICYDRTGEATLEGRGVGPSLDGVELEFRARGRFTVRSAAVRGRGTFSPKDRGEMNEFGELRLLGRVGRIAKVAGRRIDFGEVEFLLRRVAGVADAFAMLHPVREDALVAAVVSGRRSLDLRRDLARLCASWKIPERIVVLPAFPVTARGKTDTRKLRSMMKRRLAG